jgi:hypothetical protein
MTKIYRIRRMLASSASFSCVLGDSIIPLNLNKLVSSIRRDITPC